MEDVGKWHSLIYGWKKVQIGLITLKSNPSHMIPIYLFPTSIWESLYLELIYNCMYTHIYVPIYLYTYMYTIWEIYSKKYMFNNYLFCIISPQIGPRW